MENTVESLQTHEEEVLREEAPDAPGAEEWIKKNKPEFKRRYGSNWARVLYGKAWILYGKNAKNKDTAKHEASHITVTISGPVGSGKSAVAKVVQQTLAGGGLDVQFDDKGEESDASQETDLKDVSAKKVVLATHYEKPAENKGAVNEGTSSHVPPQAVRDAAKRGLELRKKYGRGGWDSKTAGENGIGSGVVRAQTLVAGKGVSPDTVKRMRSFFQRHDGEQERAARKRDETSPANIAWLLWGGDPGREWAEKIVKGEGNA
jgi:hypothetical protein